MPRPLFTTTDDVVLSGRRWVHAGAPQAAVVLVHGFSASADHPDVCDLAERVNPHIRPASPGQLDRGFENPAKCA